MALRILGEAPIDIHAAASTFVFPHHENEIAQAEGATRGSSRASGSTSNIC